MDSNTSNSTCNDTDKNSACDINGSAHSNIHRKLTSHWQMLFFPAAFVYMELVFHIAVYNSIDSNIIHPLLFAAAYGTTFALLCSFWRQIANTIIAYALWTVLSVYYIAQFVYYKIFRTFLSLVSIGGAGDAMNFRTVLFQALKANWYIPVIFLIPLAALIVLGVRIFPFDRCMPARCNAQSSRSTYSIPNRPCGRTSARSGSKTAHSKTAAAKIILTHVTVCAVTWGLSIGLLGVHGTAAYSPYNLFHGKYVLELSMNKLGVMMTTTRDGITMAAGSSTADAKTFELADGSNGGRLANGGDNADSNTDSNGEGADGTSNAGVHSGNDSNTGGYEGGQTGGNTNSNSDGTSNSDSNEGTYNGSDTDVPAPQIDESIDFTALYNSTDDETLKNLTAYFSGAEPTYTDEYTGMFEGYNVVFVTAESLSTYGISKEATPTLYKIYHEGFEFNNFYCPLWYHSTIDGEYTNCLSQYPASSKWSFEESAGTYQPYALGNVLNSLGYESFAYHDFDATYYDRTSTHPNMGYTTFKAIDAGLDLTFYNMYSDLECMETVYEDFIDKEHFNMYFMSFSGHLPYDYDYQYMCLKNREEAEKALEGKGYSDEATAYVAAQMELDKALEFLMDKLDEAGKLDNTLFVVAPDHYPYGLSDGVYNELAGKDIEDDAFELHSNAFGIWSSSMDKKVSVNKLCGSVDILPTVLNLLGADYDSRLLAGRNILSDSDELVIFANQSFITDKIRYNAGTGEVSYLVPQSQVSDSYVDDMISEVENRLYISDEIINTDYFGFVYGVEEN